MVNRQETERATYYIVIDPVQFWVCLIRGIVEMMLDRVDPKNTNLVESPASHLLAEFPVSNGHFVLGARLLHLGFDPCIRKHIGAADNGEASAVARLHSRDQA